MWIPIESMETRMIVISVVFIFALYLISYKLKNYALRLLLLLLLLMGYNQFFRKKGFTYEKAYRSYVSLVERKFENNPNLIKDINPALL